MHLGLQPAVDIIAIVPQRADHCLELRPYPRVHGEVRGVDRMTRGKVRQPAPVIAQTGKTVA